MIPRASGGEHQGIPKGENHYHLVVRTPTGRVFEPLEAESIRDTVRLIMEAALDRLDGNVSIDNIRISWRGQVLDKDTKLLDVEVDGVKLPFFVQMPSDALQLIMIDPKNLQEETRETKEDQNQNYRGIE